MGRHVLIIPDGNRRYARHHGMTYEQVYAFVAKKITVNLIKHFLIDKKFSDFSIFLISRHNILKRDSEELDLIYDAQQRMFYDLADNSIFKEHNIQFRAIGDIDLFPTEYKNAIKNLIKTVKYRNGKTCNFLLAYDGIYEIINAIKKIRGNLDRLNESNLYNYLELDKPIDLVIRTGFEKRLSGAPLIQTTFSEFYFADFYYPEFTIEKANEIIKEFDRKDRRFGE